MGVLLPWGRFPGVVSEVFFGISQLNKFQIKFPIAQTILYIKSFLSYFRCLVWTSSNEGVLGFNIQY